MLQDEREMWEDHRSIAQITPQPLKGRRSKTSREDEMKYVTNRLLVSCPHA